MNNAIEGIVIFTACAAFIAFLVFIAAAIVYMLTVTVAMVRATLPERAARKPRERASIESVRPRRGLNPISGATEARALLAAPGEAEGKGAQRGPNPLVRARDGIAQRREATPVDYRLGAHRREWQVRRTTDSPMTAAELAHKAAVSPSSARRKIKDWEAQIPPEPTKPVDVPDTPDAEPVDALGIFGGEEVDKPTV